MKPNTVKRSPISVQDSNAEWQARIELAAAYRVMAHYGLSDTIYTHISARVPGSERFLINAFGLYYEEVRASNLVTLDIDGNVLDDPCGLGANRAGFVIHSAIHQARPEVACVLHTHSVAGVAVSAHRSGLLPISQQASTLYGQIGYHDYEGIAVDIGERERLARDMGSRPAMILRNHGMLTAGRTVGEAVSVMLTLESACQIQIAAQSTMSPLQEISLESLEATRRYLSSLKGDYTRNWDAMLRLADRLDPGYRD